jgi:signal peptidase II
MKPYGRLLGAAASVIVADQVTKSVALSKLSDGGVTLIPGFMGLRITYNSGGAFGIFQGTPLVFLVAGLVIGTVILFWVRSLGEAAWLLPFGLILGGGLGNVIDRVFRAPGGEVVDFIDLHFRDFQWPLFNVADMAIVIGVGLVLITSGRADKEEKEDDADTGSEAGPSQLSEDR